MQSFGRETGGRDARLKESVIQESVFDSQGQLDFSSVPNKSLRSSTGSQELVTLPRFFAGGTCRDSEETAVVRDKSTQLFYPCHVTAVADPNPTLRGPFCLHRGLPFCGAREGRCSALLCSAAH
uniref:Uncharacterized protein n=1 Tax=Rousettus aegyptiacus TaxID=9407 RepID=A0A7J8EJN7_ROUAE|nr:hypothetical protein HJG63_012465 [Rousettus aegyptiacus]